MTAKSKSKALTLVELVAALAIVSLLLVASMRVIAGVARSERQGQAQYEEATRAASVRAVLTADLLHATAVSETPGGYEVRTMNCLDGRTMERRHWPATVEYQVQQLGPRRWLVRIQRPLTLGQELRELVGGGIAKLELRAGDSDTPASYDATVTFESPDEAPLRWSVRKD